MNRNQKKLIEVATRAMNRRVGPGELSEMYDGLRHSDPLRDFLVGFCDDEAAESPVEKMMLTAFDFLIPNVALHGSAPAIHLQYPVDLYRIDIAILGRSYTDKPFKIAVECDGHDHHDLTKQQAEHDRKRDRALMAAHWKVMRFTGTEILRNPFACAMQVLDLYSSAAELGSWEAA